MLGSVKSAPQGWRPARGWQEARALGARQVEERQVLASSTTAPFRGMKPSRLFCDMPGAPPCVGNVKALGGLGNLGFVGCQDVQAQVEELRKLAADARLSQASRTSAMVMLKDFDDMNLMVRCDKYAGQLTPVLQSLRAEVAAGSRPTVVQEGAAASPGPGPASPPSWLMPAAIGAGIFAAVLYFRSR